MAKIVKLATAAILLVGCAAGPDTAQIQAEGPGQSTDSAAASAPTSPSRPPSARVTADAGARPVEGDPRPSARPTTPTIETGTAIDRAGRMVIAGGQFEFTTLPIGRAPAEALAEAVVTREEAISSVRDSGLYPQAFVERDPAAELRFFTTRTYDESLREDGEPLLLPTQLDRVVWMIVVTDVPEVRSGPYIEGRESQPPETLRTTVVAVVDANTGDLLNVLSEEPTPTG